MKRIHVSGRALWYAIPLLLVAIALGYFFTQQARPVERRDAPVVEAEKPKPTPPNADEMLRLVNEERAKVGSTPLRYDPRLQRSAQAKADDMISKGYYGHKDSSGKEGYTLVFEYAPECRYASENLTGLFPQDFSSEGALSNWKESTAHFNALIDAKYDLTGFGIAGDKVVEHFCDLP